MDEKDVNKAMLWMLMEILIEQIVIKRLLVEHLEKIHKENFGEEACDWYNDLQMNSLYDINDDHQG